MNKYQEALDSLKAIVESNGTHSEYTKYLNTYVVAMEDIDTLQELVSKNKPMKPKIKMCIHNSESINVLGGCPKCGIPVSWKQNYCSKCGQKLDWSEDNE